MDLRTNSLAEAITNHQKILDLYHLSPHKPETYTTIEFKESFLNFSSSFIKLINNVNPKANNKLYQYLFSHEINKKTLPAHLICAREYLEDLQQRVINDTNMDYYISTEIKRVLFDYFKLLWQIHKEYNIQVDFISHSSRIKEVDSYFTYELAQKIFRGNHDLHQTMLTEGLSIFTIRQSCELYSKEILGIRKLKFAKSSAVYLYGSALPLKFLAAKEHPKHFNLTYDPQEIYTIYKWSNSYIHTGKFSQSYIVFKALKQLEPLHKLQKHKNDKNGMDFRSVNGIKNYKQVQQLFMEFINRDRGRNLLVVEWRPKQSRYMRYEP